MRPVDLQNLVANAGALQRVLQASQQAQQAAHMLQANEAQKDHDRETTQVEEAQETEDKVIEEHQHPPRQRFGRREGPEGGEGKEGEEPSDSGKRPLRPDGEGRFIDVEV